jgi:transposase-like protein
MAAQGVNDALREEIRELRVWLKLANWETVRARFVRLLDDEKKRAVYQATDGQASTREIGSLVGIDQKTVSNWWRQWAEEGLVEPGPLRNDRPRKVISLDDLGLV